MRHVVAEFGGSSHKVFFSEEDLDRHLKGFYAPRLREQLCKYHGLDEELILGASLFLDAKSIREFFTRRGYSEIDVAVATASVQAAKYVDAEDSAVIVLTKHSDENMQKVALVHELTHSLLSRRGKDAYRGLSAKASKLYDSIFSIIATIYPTAKKDETANEEVLTFLTHSINIKKGNLAVQIDQITKEVLKMLDTEMDTAIELIGTISENIHRKFPALVDIAEPFEVIKITPAEAVIKVDRDSVLSSLSNRMYIDLSRFRKREGSAADLFEQVMKSAEVQKETAKGVEFYI